MNQMSNSEPATQLVTHRHQAFIPLVVTTFFIWLTYRVLFSFPVWIDESVGKLIFFGLPVCLYAILAQTKVIQNTLDPKKLLIGLYLGLAYGGLYGFVGAFSVLMGKSNVDVSTVFLTSAFWWEFFLAMMTGFWESLFFFGWIMTIAEKRFPEWSIPQLVGFTSLVFVVFHLPNTFLRFELQFLIGQIFLLSIFALGQSLIFLRYRNLYTLTLSHAFWGMVLLIYGS